MSKFFGQEGYTPPSPKLRDRMPMELGNFTVVCVVTWPLNGSEAGGDLVLIQTFFGHYWKCLELALGLEPENQIVAVEIRKSKGV